MTGVVSRGIGGWRVLCTVLSVSLLLSCSGSQEPESEPPLQTPEEEKPPEMIAGGQSGSEGGGEGTPCLSEMYPLVAGVVTAIDGGCATVSEVEVLIGAGVLTSADEGTSLRGAYRPHFSIEPIAVGQTVYAIYQPDPLGKGTATLRLAIVEDSTVLLVWRNISYESSLEELLSEECGDLFLERPEGEALPEPEDIPTPLSCEDVP